jgi:hypothetical protein
MVNAASKSNADLDSLTPRFAVEARAAIQTYLAALFSEEESQPEPQTAATEVVAASPEATLPRTPMRLKIGGTHLGYHVHYVVDGGKARVILQVLVTPSEVMDNQPMRDLTT